MLKFLPLVLLLLCGPFAGAQQPGPFNLGRIDQTPGEMGNETVSTAPFLDGNLIFDNTGSNGHLYFFDGQDLTFIESTSPNKSITDVGALPGGRVVALADLTTGASKVYLLSEADLSLTLLHQEPIRVSAVYTVNDRLIIYDQFAAEDRFYLTVSGNPAESAYLPILSKVILFFNEPVITFNGSLVFSTLGGLYISDGTVDGTEWLANTGTVITSKRLAVHNNQLFYAAGRDIYVSDGTAATTRRLTDNSFPAALTPLALGELTSTPGGLLYTARTALHGAELFITDGTAAGSSLFQEFTPGTADGVYLNSSFNGGLTAPGLFAFVVGTEDNFDQLWQSDGTEAGTFLVEDFPQPFGNGWKFNTLITTEDQEVYWELDPRSEGQDQGIVYGAKMGDAQPEMVKVATFPGGLSSLELEVVSAEGWLIMQEGGIISRPKTTLAVYRVDSVLPPLENGTTILFNQAELLLTATHFFARAGREETGREPHAYRLDGSGQDELLDVNPGPGSSDGIFFQDDNQVYFLARNAAIGYAIYQTDGTPAGTSLVTDLHQRGGSSSVDEIIGHGPYLMAKIVNEPWEYVNFSRDTLMRYPSHLPPGGELVGPYFMINWPGPPIAMTTEEYWEISSEPDVTSTRASLPVRWQNKFVFIGSHEVEPGSFHWQMIVADPYSRTVEIPLEAENVAYGLEEEPVGLASDGAGVFFGFPSVLEGINVPFFFDGTANPDFSGSTNESEVVTRSIKGLNNEIAGFHGEIPGSAPEISIAVYARSDFAYFQYPWNDEVLRAVVQLTDYPMVMTNWQLSHSYDNFDLEEDEDDILLDDHTSGYTLASLTKINETDYIFLRQTEAESEIWTTDGTSSGTRMINSYAGRAINETDKPLPTVFGWLSFTVERPDGNRYLHIYDYRDNELYELGETSADGGWPSAAVSLDGRFYFLLTDATHGREIHYLDFGFANSAPGQVYADVNENGIREDGEPGVIGQPVSIESEGQTYRTFSDDSGAYEHYFLPEVAYSYTIEPTNCWESVISDGPIDTVAAGALSAPDFPLRPRSDAEGARSFLSSGVNRCGFIVPFWIRAINNGCRPLSEVTVALALGNDGTFISATDEPDAMTEGSLSWTDISLPVGTSFSTEVMVEMPDENRAGEELSFRLITQGHTENGDVVSDTTYYLPTLRCAIDPNDKLVTPSRPEESNSNYTRIDETLTYTIRFQNTGNDTALNVRLEDQLAAELDLKTFRPIAASHDYRVELEETGRLKVYFEDIFLPDSNVNAMASHGFFAFDIDLKEEGLNTTVENTAGIFFDFNAAVVTNTVTNSIVEFLDEDQDSYFFWEECDDQNPGINPGVPDIGGNGIDEDCDGHDWTTSLRDPLPGTLQMFPNPTSGEITLTYSLPGKLLVIVFDGRGRRMQTRELKSSGRIDLSGLPPAVYHLRVMEVATGRFATRRVVKK